MFSLKLAVACLLLVLATATPVRASLFGTNLIVNGDAEAGPASVDGYQVVASIPGWTTNGEFNVIPYSLGGGFPMITDPGPINRGSNFFAGGQNDAVSTGTQLINVAGASQAIDAGRVACSLSGYLGGYSSQSDNATLSIIFSNSVPAILGSVSIGPVLPADRTNLTGLFFRQTNSIVPPGTRTILITLLMTRIDGNFNDGYADNLSLVFNPVLSINLTGALASVSWSTNNPGYGLQSTTNLALPLSWTAWPGQITTNGSTYSASTALTNNHRFFRLVSP